MGITFKSHDGLCPYYIYREYKFFIRDKADYHGHYKYALYMQRMTEETKVFNNNRNAIRYVEAINGIKHIYTQSGTGKRLYGSKTKEYVIIDNTVTIRPAEEMISWYYDRYADCVKFAKKYIDDFIKTREPEQLALNLSAKQC